MDAQLIDTPDEHHWVLVDYRVSEIIAGDRWFALRAWSLGGSLDVRVGAPGTLVLPSGLRRELRPGVAESLAPLLALVGAGVRSLTVARGGALALAFSDESVLGLPQGGRAEAWEVQGGGVLEGMSYDASGGGTPWS